MEPASMPSSSAPTARSGTTTSTERPGPGKDSVDSWAQVRALSAGEGDGSMSWRAAATAPSGTSRASKQRRRSAPRGAQIKALLAQQHPGRRKGKIGADQRRMLRKPAFRGEGQKARDQADGFEAGHGRRLFEAFLGQRHAVVDEVPVGSADQPNIRLQHEHATTGPQNLRGDLELPDHRFWRRQVLEVVAHEGEVEVTRGHRLMQVETAGLHEAHVSG